MNKYTWGADGVARGNFVGINIWCICGIPEGVILPVKDSKKTNKKQRAEIFNQIKDNCIWSLGSATPDEIDIFGIQDAERLALVRAYSLIYQQGYLITELYGDLSIPSMFARDNLIKYMRSKDADDHIPAVSAASILAKHALDLYWDRVHEHYPQYEFTKNAGYGVKAKEAIAQFGLLEGIHRYSYKPCKDYLNEKSN